MPPRDPMDSFKELGGPAAAGTTAPSDYYPGSKRKRKAVVEEDATPPPAEDVGTEWYETPVVIVDGRGVKRKLYLIGHLAMALGREVQIVRKWERHGYIPKATMRTTGRGQYAQRRLYTRAQIEGLVKLATEEGLMDAFLKVSHTNFPKRAELLFARLAGKAD